MESEKHGEERKEGLLYCDDCSEESLKVIRTHRTAPPNLETSNKESPSNEGVPQHANSMEMSNGDKWRVIIIRFSGVSERSLNCGGAAEAVEASVCS